MCLWVCNTFLFSMSPLWEELVRNDQENSQNAPYLSKSLLNCPKISKMSNSDASLSKRTCFYLSLFNSFSLSLFISLFLSSNKRKGRHGLKSSLNLSFFLSFSLSLFFSFLSFFSSSFCFFLFFFFSPSTFYGWIL